MTRENRLEDKIALTKGATLEIIKEHRLIAVVRVEDPRDALDAVAALWDAGVICVEITMTVPDAVAVIQELVRSKSGVLIGAGTVMSVDQVDACVEAGARFIVSPALLPDVMKRSRELGCVTVPGVMTPTEAVVAWRSGADLVKIFPAARLGPSFISDLKGPLPDIPLMPTGGITDETAEAYLIAGADVVCTGSWLVDREAIAARDFDVLREKGRRIVSRIQRCRR